MAPGLQMASSLPNTSFLTRHVLEHRLDDEIAVGERFQVGAGLEIVGQGRRPAPPSCGRA